MTTRYNLWLKLGRPEGVYSVWSNQHWNEFGRETLGRSFGHPERDDADLERGLFILHNQTNFNTWLAQKYQKETEVPSSYYYHVTNEVSPFYGVYTRRIRRGTNHCLFRPQGVATNLPELFALCQSLMDEANAAGKPIEVSIQPGRSPADFQTPYAP